MIGKKELVALVAEKAEMTKRDAELFLDVLSDIVAEKVEDGETVKVGSLVTFEAVDVKAREAKNPKTKEPVQVDAHRKVRAKVSDTLKNRVR